MIDIPSPLLQALENGRAVLFLGAGIGGHLHRPDATTMPTGSALATDIASYFNLDTQGNTDLSQVAQFAEIKKGRPSLDAFIRERLSGFQPDEVLKALTKIPWRAIFTTNYDEGILAAYRANPNPLQTPIAIASTGNIRYADPRLHELPVYFLHGALEIAGAAPLLITETDYIRFREGRSGLFAVLNEQFSHAVFLYVGYSNNDSNWKALRDEIQREIPLGKAPLSYRLSIEGPSMADALLVAQNINTLHCSLDELTQALATQMHDVHIPDEALKKLEDSIPSDFADDFQRSPAAVARFFSSWQYVNQIDLSGASHISAFLRGDRASWAVIGQEHCFRRDIEDTVYEELLDYATSGTLRDSLTILGHAGAGTTTLLMALAGRLVREGAGPVYFLKPGAQVLEGDILFAALRDPTVKPFFFVDNAALEKERLHNIVQRIAASRSNGMLVLGARLNEWRQAPFRLVSKERQLLSLSLPEITRLLSLLEAHNELGVLADLAPALRVTKIENSNGGDLLVTLREATEGCSFDAIIESEFLGIQSELAKRLYSIVCCFYQKQQFVRDTLLARLLEIDTSDMYRETNAATEGIVIYESLDEANGIYGARARHRVIAQIVWDRCGSRADREDLLLRAMRSLNLAYKWDRDAFDLLVRSDELVDFFSSLDRKIAYFDAAVNKAPDNPYVRQHYARMLMREQREPLALSQINEALELNNDILALHHTKGMILSQLALRASSPEFGRRYLLQAEESYQACITRDRRDDYGYQSLAHLYLEWAKGCSNPDDEINYIDRAEQAISLGLRSARRHESLWLESAKIEDYLENSPARLLALQKAHESSPNSAIPVFLLARALRRAGRTTEAKAVLEPFVTKGVDDFRVFIEYAKCLLALGGQYSEAAAALRIASIGGMSDPKYVATLGGLLFLAKDYTAAEKIFAESGRRGFSLEDRTRIFYRPRQGGAGARLRTRGVVTSTKGNYAFVQPVDFARDVFCPRSRISDELLNTGTPISFELCFTSRGATTDKLAADESEVSANGPGASARKG